MSKGLSYLFKNTIGHIQANLSKTKFSVKNILTQLKKRNKSFDSFPKEIADGSQGKHIIGHSNYKPGRSILTLNMREAQSLVNKYSGKGQQINSNKERVDFNRPIGIYINQSTGQKSVTTIGIIHYSKKGTHIVPAQPRK